MNLKNWDGERLETFVHNEVAVEHLHRYAIVVSLAAGKSVLDIASGEGYGSNLIAGVASSVTGVDISAEAIHKAKTKYEKKNLEFIIGSAAKIPVGDHLFDIVVSFETIEHHDKHEEMFAEIKRVLKPDGLLIMSSPDKLNYTDKRNFHNPFHVKELYADEFKALVRKNFSNSTFYYQRATFVSLLIPDSGTAAFREYSGDYDRVSQAEDFRQMYILCYATNGTLPENYLTAFTDDNLLFRLNNETISKVRSTISYQIGNSMLWPFKKLRKLFQTAETAK